MDLDIHNRRRRLDLVLARVRSSPAISDENRIQILKFSDYGFAEGLSVERVEHYLHILNKIAEKMKETNLAFTDANKDDIVKLVGWVERREISDWTKHDYKVTFKKFYKWLKGDGETTPVEVRWIKATKRKNNTLPDELLSEEDIEKLLEATRHPRDRALISVLYESGCRIGELLTLRIKHIKFNKHGARLIVNGKTGMRRIIIIASSPDLAAWLNVHPFKSDPNSPLWVGIGTGNRDKPLKYPSARKMLRVTAKRAGVVKKVNPHLLRHSRATFLAKHLTEAQLCEYLGWVQGSKMASTYVHLSGRDVDGALLKLYGFEDDVDVSDDDRLAPVRCPRCKELNSSGSRYCVRCSLPLDEETAEREQMVRGEVDRGMEGLFRDHEFKAFVARKLQELSQNQE